MATHQLLRRLVWAQDPTSGQLIIRRAAPLAAEMPVQHLAKWMTPNELFHVLTNIATTLPAIDPTGWRLGVEGHVNRSLTLGFDH